MKNFFPALLDSTSLVIYLKDIEGRYLYVNRRYELLAKVPREALIGKLDHDFFAPQVADLFQAQDAQVAALRAPIEFEETIPLPGGVHSFITEKFPLFNAKGEVEAVGGFCTEITSQKNRADESLAEERERLSVTVRSIGEGVIATDTNGAVILLNPAAESLAGVSQADAGGRSVDEILVPAAAAAEGGFGRLVREALAAAGAPAPARDMVIVSKSGTERTVVPAASAVRDRRGNIIGAVLTLRDVTEQRRSEEELFKVRSLESLGFLAGGIAHDFNNLLTGIIGNLGLLGEEPTTSAATRATLKDAMETCWKAKDLSQQLLTFASGGTSEREPIALGPLLSDTAHLILHDSNVTALVDFADGLWPVEADRTQLSQVVANLLINAREAMPNGGTVEIQGENHALAEPLFHLPTGRYVRLTVRDDGPGIPAAALARIFNPYFSSKKRGSGLGLAIVYSIVRRHGGHVWAESTEGKGTVFTILFPTTDKPVVHAHDAEPGDLVTGSGRILLMDDDDVVAHIAEKILRRAGYTVRVECEGAAAVAAYRDALAAGERFDAVILDIMVLGGTGGKEAAAEILALDPNAGVILSSGYSMDGLGEDGVERFRLLKKPYTIRQLTGMVAAAIQE